MSVLRDRLGCNKPNGETTTIQTHVRRSAGRVARRALVYRTNVRRTCVQEVTMSAIAVPPSPRSTSRSQSRRRAAGQASCRPRLQLVTEDFVPEVRSRLEGDETGPRSAPPASLSTTPPMRRPSTPAALRDRRSELERLAPQHPAVRAARLREDARRGAAALSAQQDAPSPSQRDGRVDRAARPRVALYLLRGGSLGVAAAIALVCCGLLVGVLMGMASPSSAAPAAQESAGTTTTVVRPGESLWEIAAASGTADVSGMVTRIVELNDLRDTTVHAGQTLEIPAA